MDIFVFLVPNSLFCYFASCAGLQGNRTREFGIEKAVNVEKIPT